MSEDDLEKQELSSKKVAFYAAFLEAWISNRMEIDKQLLTLSSLALGLLVIFYKELDTILQFIIWIISGSLYIATMIMIFTIFNKNTRYIECLLVDHKQHEEKELESTLQKATSLAFQIFIAAVALTFALIVMKTGVIELKIATKGV